MKLQNLFCLLAALLLSSCKEEKKEETVTVSKTETISETRPNNNPELEKLVDAFIHKKEEVEKQLNSASPEEANALYEKYTKENDSAIVSIEKLEEHFMNNYYGYFFSDEGREKPVADSIQQKVDILKKGSLEVWDIGEGMVEIRTVPEYYKDIFGKYVTEDYREFIAMQAIDDSVLWSADAGIVITWKELAQRMINWENFVQKYPDSKLITQAMVLYKMYQLSYLLGQDNTPTYERSDNILYPENVEEFKRFIREYPKSPTAKLVQQMLDNNGKGFDMLQEEMQKEFEAAYNALKE